MTLLFGAQLPSSGPLQNIRASIAGLIVKASAERIYRPCVIDMIGSDKRSVNGHQWKLDAAGEKGLAYTIHRSRDLPFGFGRVHLAIPGQFDVNTELVDFGTSRDSLLDLEEELKRRAAETAGRLTDLDVHAWAIPGKLARVVGRYEAYTNHNPFGPSESRNASVTLGLIDLDAAGGRTDTLKFVEVEFNDLSEDDHRWIADNQMRDWTSITGKHTRRGLFDYLRDQNTVVLLCDDLTSQDATLKLLSKKDQDYVRQALRAMQ